MPIRIPENLPAFETLEKENIFVMPKFRAEHQDIRPLRVLILNLMPKKIETETQLMRLLSNTPLQVDVELLQVEHISKNTSLSHLEMFYKTFDEVKNGFYDGMILTGAPVEQLAFHDVDYWDELCEIMTWTRTHVYSTMYICWAALAGLYFHYGIEKHPLEKKLFGVFPHKAESNNPILRGFDDIFPVPHSRHSEVHREDIEKCSELEILSYSPLAGVYMVASRNGREFYVTGHSEYERDTLKQEYERDLAKGLPIDVPWGYFPGDNPNCEPIFSWRCHANLMYSNWLNYCVYQKTPFEITELANMEGKA
ncbi:MAG: homoserine O-succinyltransferase [Oscillospiraceae bacterium]|nr:homoserine O-succinyltransferase [Oscillospiraceae bacterium]